MTSERETVLARLAPLADRQAKRYGQLRLYIARKRLLAAESVAAVAYNVGLESRSRFDRNDRMLHGLTPTQAVATVRQELRDHASPTAAASAAPIPPIKNESTR